MKKYLPKLISYVLIYLLIFPQVVLADYVEYSTTKNSPVLVPTQSGENIRSNVNNKPSGIMKFDKDTSTVYSLNKETGKIEITPLPMSTSKFGYGKNTVSESLDIKKNVLSYIWRTVNEDFKFGELTSMDISEALGIIALTVSSEDYDKSGLAIFTDYRGKIIKVVSTGVQPESIVFSPNAKSVIISNSGRATEGTGANDPEGSVTVISLNGYAGNIKDSDVIEIGFKHLDSKKAELVNSGIFMKRGRLPSRGLEPGEVAVEENSRYAYISLPENNAIAKIDLRKMIIESVSAVKTNTGVQNEKSFVQPVGIKAVNHNGKVYLLTANIDSSMTIIKDGKEGLETVFDSTSSLTKVLKDIYPNGLPDTIANNPENKASLKNYLELGHLRSRTYAFLTLGFGGIAVFDVTDPQNTFFESFIGSDSETPLSKPIFINGQFDLNNQPILLVPGVNNKDSEVFELKFN